MKKTTNTHPDSSPVLLIFLLGLFGCGVQAAKLLDVGVLDEGFLLVHIADGEVMHHEGATGEEVVRYMPELATGIAQQTGSWSITSTNDPNYGNPGQHPQNCHLKKKLNGHAQLEWSGSDYLYEYTYEHWIYLHLPSPLLQGATYTLNIDAGSNIDTPSSSFTFSVFSSRSEAVHVNLAGYHPAAPHKAADLYHWMGDGGARDYSLFEGNAVYLYNVDTDIATQVGMVDFWMAGGSDAGGYNLTRSDVWNVDFSGFTMSGTYRLAVEGVGCSQDFEISEGAYSDPFAVSLRGYFYMRIGETNPTDISPPPRTPLYIPGISPASTTVYLTSMHPWHPDWESLAAGDNWDHPDAWASYRLTGNPTNPNAWGGHSDAADWDRHIQHVVNIYDMLLPFIMANGAIGDDDTGITESGNGIPDLLDEARNEVDFWLRLRDGQGYSSGLTNPNGNNELFQAGPTAIAAWVNAANAAMLADAFRMAGSNALMNTYRDAALEAYNHADGLADPMLDEGMQLDDGFLRGRDLKMMAAAFLYNVTGTQLYENVVYDESVCSATPSTLKNNSRNQIYGTAAYLATTQTIHYPTLQDNMKTQIINEAKNAEANHIDSRPSRRAVDQTPAYWRTAQFVDRTIIAHAVADDPVDKAILHKALALEAAWGLGRNPMNMIEMTTAFTPLQSKRSVTEAYTSGRNDGFAGVHPGHTPYMNLSDWAPSMVMGRPSALYENSYPGNVASSWPRGETYYPSRWVWAHSEFTPRQTMRSKMALYAYLQGLAATAAPTNPVLVVVNSSVAGGSGSVTSSPPGIDCGPDCSEAYTNGTVVALTATADAGSVFAGWSGACYGTNGTCTVTMSVDRLVMAEFEPEPPAYVPTVEIYGDALASGWSDWSWNATIDMAGTSPVQSGTHAVNATLNGWGGFSPSMPSGSIDTLGYHAIVFWAHGGSGSDKLIRFYTSSGGTDSGSIDIAAPTNTWTKISIPLDSLGNPASISRLHFFNNSSTALPMITFDEIRLLPSTDIDGDGMPNSWETLYFGGPTNAVSGANPDGDSYTNHEEYIAGLNPTNSDGLFISNLAIGATNIFEWTAATGRIYTVHWTDNLLNGFSALQSNLASGFFTDVVHGAETKGFYKLEVQLE